MATSSKGFRVSLPPKLQVWVTRKVSAGAYASTNEVMLDAIVALQERERETEEARQRVRAQIEEGAASVERGDVYDGEAVFDEVLRALDNPDINGRSKRGSSSNRAQKRKRK